MQMHRGANLIWKLFSGQFSYTAAVVATHMEFHEFKLIKKAAAISPQKFILFYENVEYSLCLKYNHSF